MSTYKWIKQNTESLEGKTVAISGSTGGIGQQLCKILASLGADLVCLDRNPQKAEALREMIYFIPDYLNVHPCSFNSNSSLSYFLIADDFLA